MKDYFGVKSQQKEIELLDLRRKIAHTNFIVIFLLQITNLVVLSTTEISGNAIL